MVTRLQQKELFHPAAIECPLPVCIDWACPALVHSAMEFNEPAEEIAAIVMRKTFFETDV